MSGIIELLVLLLPLLLSGRLLSTIVSRLTPILLEKLKESSDRKKLREMYRHYATNPENFEQLQPQLASFFKDNSWMQCHCHNCHYLRKKLEADNKAA